MVVPQSLLESLSLSLSASHAPVSSGLSWWGSDQTSLASYSPVDGKLIARSGQASPQDYDRLVTVAQSGFLKWREVPAPKRGEVVRLWGEALRKHKQALGALVSYEMGKSLQEGLGEVQEMIDICDFAVGLSRQLYGLSMHSERHHHRMYEQWHPLGLVGIISAFNFPVAVWAWNAAIAVVCGNATLWKPSEKTPLTALSCFHILKDVLQSQGVPEGVFGLVIGGASIGEQMAQDPRVSLVSATGSSRMGRRVAEVVGKRLGRTILELGGNNAMILAPSADLKLAIPALVFGAVGTAGQRCTTTRRAIIHESIYLQVKGALIKAYGSLRIGNPLDESNHVGPLIDLGAVEAMGLALAQAKSQGGTLLWGGDVLAGAGYESGCYVRPALVEAQNHWPVVQEETFAPILYLMSYSGELSEAIRIQNQVPQGLSSSLFTSQMRESEAFLSAWGSDCGIANINIGTSGAEIGGAFGGEKDTGGGRESGSDSWKAYMRRQTNTINFSKSLPLAQGIRFEL